MADYAIHDTTLEAIADTIRKKDGTQALIDPADYPKRINLMGMLEEKTQASAPVCYFSDGADDVPTDSVKITMPASLSGVSAVSVVNNGKNLIDLSTMELGYISNIGAFVNIHTQGEMRSGFIEAKPNTTYTFAIVETTTTHPSWVGIGEYSSADTSDFIQRQTTWTFTTSPTTKYIAVSARNIEGASKIQLELGSSPSPYTPYIQPTTYTASLGRTIYGGEVDIVNGVGTVTHGKYSVTGQETGDFLAGTNNNGNRIGIRIIGAQTPLYAGGISNIGENKACLASSSWTIGSWCIYTDNKLYFVVPNEYTTFATALQYLVNNNATFVFPLAAQPDFTFDGQEIPTRLGYNCFISEQGDTSVAYRASGTIHQYPKGEEASF